MLKSNQLALDLEGVDPLGPLVSMALNCMFVGQVNMYLLCQLLQRSGLSPSEVDDALSLAGSGANENIAVHCAEWSVVPEGLRDVLRDRLNKGHATD